MKLVKIVCRVFSQSEKCCPPNLSECFDFLEQNSKTYRLIFTVWNNSFELWCPDYINVYTNKGEILTANFPSAYTFATPWVMLRYIGG